MDRMRNSRQPDYRLPPQMCGELGELILQTLWNSPYRFGHLRIEEPQNIRPIHRWQNYRPQRRFDELCVVIHRSMGLLLMADCQLGPNDRRERLKSKIETAHQDLVETQRKLRPLVAKSIDPRNSAPTLGIGLVVREFTAPSDLPTSLPKEIIIDESQLNDMNPNIERLFQFFSSDGAVVPMIPADQLMTALSDIAIGLGDFADEKALVAHYNYHYRLFPPLPPVA